MGVDYYGVLQISRTSTDLEVKKAYRNLALEFNVERNQDPNAHQVFTLIGEAYDVLSNPLRRAVFDQYGEEGLKRGVPTQNEYIPGYHYHGDPMKTYREFFGTCSPYADLLDVLKDPPRLCKTVTGIQVCKKQPPIKHPLQLTLHEVFFGGVKKMKIHRLVFVNDERTVTEVREKILTIPIKPGMQAGTEIIFPNEGDQNPASIPADVIFITEDRPHELFVRRNDDLILTTTISLEDALVGTVVTVHTIDHRIMRIPITDVVNPDFEKVVEREGLPILDQYPEKGNLILRFHIEFPTYLPRSCKDILKSAFELAKMGGGEKNYHESINKIVLADKILRVVPEEQLPPLKQG
ncbi:dnaJ homolog subfamily B member 13-like [Anthonomus grandis grandis]|uniref:dnaJ homolog subfamily B member 13-like n=1 Tax=Anthonomus grandis grandis TaxID=2921223 RepID=UPI0021668FA1|nr:dnaJ homolog subfamily B member 13-like [Anthonomus grandis grandis]